ncbi:nitrate- and nitrite sensing domain-containing protein [Halomonas sp. HNIBRBA4712]|uniref:nitrate- and nitrite sensing domain-containing protein n=1 Tax=Halomonas sp. HNIBRBA4712 TaxID=3373087 RepID=UPI003744B39D
MSSGRKLLLTALRFDIESLRHLAASCDMVGDISRFIHALQRERGASTIYLASKGAQFAARRQTFVEEVSAAEALIRSRLEEFAEAPHPQATGRLLRRIATVWMALDELSSLRHSVESFGLSPDAATLAFNELIGGLLAIVFEAADTAADPDITRALVAIFHLMQGKELAGQERACGAFGFTYGHFDEPHRALLTRLTQDQNRCFDTFLEFAGSSVRESWETRLSPQTLSHIEALRDSASRADRGPSRRDARVSETWYALTTQRIDALREVEACAIEELARLCHLKISRAQQALEAARAPRKGASSAPGEQLLALTGSERLGDLTTSALTSPLGRSLIELTHAQSSRLQGLSDELENTRKALRERKLIERAKGLIMAHQSMSEEQAYRFLRKTSMDQSKSMANMAQSILELSSMLERKAP